MKKIFSLIMVCLMASMVWGETMYVISGKCNVPLTAGMNSAKYQIFTWDGTTATVTTAITPSITGTGGSYYNSTSLAMSDIKNLSNYTAGSSSTRTMQAIKVSGSNALTLKMGSKIASKIIAVGRANSNDALTITVLGESVSTSSKDFFVKEVTGTFTGDYTAVNNTSSKEFNFFFYVIEAPACDGPTFTTHPATAADIYKVGATANALTVEASGTGVTYQWYSNSTASNTGGTAISNAKNASYTPSTTSAGTTYYYCEAKASDCAVATASNVSGAITVQAKSADASLSDLKVNGSTIAGFSATKTSYDITLPAGSGQPTVVPTANDADATLGTVNISSPSANTYVATFSVTAEDGTPANYTINFTVDDGNPKITSFVVSGVTATINQSAHTITAELPNGTSLTSLTPTVTITNASSYSPTGAQNFSNPVTYTVGSVSYTVTLTVSQLSTDATLSSLIVAGHGNILEDGKFTYDLDVQASSTVPTVQVTTNEAHATPEITAATGIPGTTTIVVTAQDGTTQKTYKVNFNVVVPPSGLTTHEPDLYDAPESKGGYDTPLKINGGREYEVYYAGRAASNSLMAIRTTPGDKMTGIEDQNTVSATACHIGWGDFTTASTSNSGTSATAEFDAPTDVFKTDGNTLKIDIQGYDQFSFYAADKNVEIKDGAFKKNQRFQVFIDGNMQPETQCNTNATVRRYDISTVRHVIEVKALSDGQSLFYAFSLRVSDDPRTKHLKGNDSTQVIYQTNSIRPIYYFTKYNNGQDKTTELEWVGNIGTGIDLTIKPKATTTQVGDSMYLSGKANCPVGLFQYRIVAKKNGAECNFVTGKFTVTSKMDYVQSGDTVQICDLGVGMNAIRFRAYAIAESQISLVWAGGNAPAGITPRFETTENGNYYYIEGVPTVEGTYKYTVSLGESIFTGQLSVVQRDYTNSILYLCKNVNKYSNRNNGGSSGYDAFYDYLLINKEYNVIPRQANPTTVQSSSAYSKYQKMVVISEDVDGSDVEAIEIARGGIVNLPVLNMKGFTYNTSRLGWGFPDNGSKANKSIQVKEPSHPIFNNSSAPIMVFDNVPETYKGKLLMPIEITKQNSMCLALAPKATQGSDKEDGDLQTIIHEVPKDDRSGQKYIAFPISREACAYLSSTGKGLIDRIITYLTTNQTSPVVLPEYRIDRFVVNGVAGIINQEEKTIRFELSDIGPDVSAVIPEVTLANQQKTWWEANPSKSTVLSDGTIQMNLSNSNSVGVWVAVRDYINVVKYMVFVQVPTGIEEVYVDGDWYDVYDYMGRKVASTNESMSSIDLPHGMYIIRTARGTLKIFR